MPLFQIFNPKTKSVNPAQELPNELMKREPGQMFSHSRSSVDYLRYYKRWLGNLALKSVAEAIAKDPSYGKSDYTLKMRSASNTIMPSFYRVDKDEFGVKVASDGPDGRVVFFRRKGPWKILRGTKMVGGAPEIVVNNHDFSAKGIFSDLHKWSRDKRISESARLQLTLLKNFMEVRMLQGSVAVESIACGSSSTAKSNAVALMEDIGKLLETHAKNEAAFRTACAKEAESLDFGKTVFACKSFPLLPKNLPKTNLEDAAESAASELLSAFPKNEVTAASALSKHLRRYVQKVLYSEFGVQILDRGTMDYMSELILVLESAEKNERNPESKKHIIAYSDKIDSAFSDLYQKILDVEQVLDSFSREKSDDPKFWAKSIFWLAIKRQKIFDLIVDLLPENSGSTVALDGPTKAQINVLFTTMALNLCKISKRERLAWQDFIEYSSLQDDKAKKNWPNHFAGKPQKEARKAISRFTKEALSELDSTALLVSGDGTVDRVQHKISQDRIEQEIFSKIGAISAHSPLLASMLSELHDSTRSHLGYRQEERLPPNLQDTYLSHSAITASLLLQLESSPGSDPSRIKAARDAMLESIKQNAEAISLIGSNPEVVNELLSDVDKLLYTKARAFDLESDTEGLRQRGSRGIEIDVEYWLSISASEGGKVQRILNLSFNEQTLQIALDRPFPGDEGFNPVEIPVPPEQDLIKGMYGAKLNLSDFGIPRDASLSEKYVSIAELSISDQETYLRIKNALSNFDLSTPYALLSVADAGYQSGSIAPERFGRVTPSILSARDELGIYQGVESQFGGDASSQAMVDLEQFKSVKVAERARRYIDANLPYYIHRYASELFNREIQNAKPDNSFYTLL